MPKNLLHGLNVNLVQGLNLVLGLNLLLGLKTKSLFWTNLVPRTKFRLFRSYRFAYNIGGCGDAADGAKCKRGLHVCAKCFGLHSIQNHE